MTQANFKKMAYYGPKTVNEKGDTVYYRVPDINFTTDLRIDTLPNIPQKGKWVSPTGLAYISKSINIDTIDFPVYVILFLHDSLKKDGYKLSGIYDYVQYKSAELKNIPIFFVSDDFNAMSENKNQIFRGTFDSLKVNQPNFYSLLANLDFDEQNYFKGKPYYVFNYFAVLVDKQRHIRGYYDPNQNSEIKRMIQEFKHLKTKDEYANTLTKNEIEKK